MSTNLTSSQNELAIATDQVKSLKNLQGEDSKRLQLSIEQMNEALIQLPHLKAEVEALKHMRLYINEIEEAVHSEVTELIHKGIDAKKSLKTEEIKWIKLPQLKNILPGMSIQLENLYNAYGISQTMVSDQNTAIEKLKVEQGIPILSCNFCSHS